MFPVNNLQQLVQALRMAKQRAKVQPLVKRDMAPGTGTNERGPALEAPSYPANAWPSDGDHD